MHSQTKGLFLLLNVVYAIVIFLDATSVWELLVNWVGQAAIVGLMVMFASFFPAFTKDILLHYAASWAEEIELRLNRLLTRFSF